MKHLYLIALIFVLFFAGSAVSSWSASEVAPTEEESLIVTSRRIAREVSGRGLYIPISCYSKYDWPHPSSLSGRRTVNAHLRVYCRGTDAHLVKITVRSRMTTIGRGGLQSVRTGRKSVTVGGEVPCAVKTLRYQARGSYRIVMPSGYRPAVHSNVRSSTPKYLKRSRTGVCIYG